LSGSYPSADGRRFKFRQKKDTPYFIATTEAADKTAFYLKLKVYTCDSIY